MTDQDMLFQNAECALGAYTALDLGPTDTDRNKDALSRAGMSLTQAEEFARRYPTVVTQFDDTADEGGMGASFSAAVFADAAGNLTVAFRGTQEGGDFFPTDADIKTVGAGYDQIVAMVNWWARVSAPAGQMVRQ